MKKLLIIAALLFVGIASKAQNYPSDYAAQIGTTVTHTNVQADTISIAITRTRTAITFKYDIAKTSGTVAGTIVLQAKITAASSTEQWTTLNTYNLTDATATNSISLTTNQYVNYRIITTTSGTSVTVHKKWLLYRGGYN